MSAYEIGHTIQNMYLESTALGLATVTIGTFYDASKKSTTVISTI